MWISNFSKINRKNFFKIKRESFPNGNGIKEMAESHFFYNAEGVARNCDSKIKLQNIIATVETPRSNADPSHSTMVIQRGVAGHGAECSRMRENFYKVFYMIAIQNLYNYKTCPPFQRVFF